MLDGEIDHTLLLDGAGTADYRSVIAFFAKQILKDLRMVGGYDVLYGKVKAFVRDGLFDGAPVDLEDPIRLRDTRPFHTDPRPYYAPRKSVFNRIVGEAGAGGLELRFARFLDEAWVVETKGREELDLPAKMARLAQWCDDATQASSQDGGAAWRFVYVDQDGFEKARPATFASLAAGFTSYQATSVAGT